MERITFPLPASNETILTYRFYEGVKLKSHGFCLFDGFRAIFLIQVLYKRQKMCYNDKAKPTSYFLRRVLTRDNCIFFSQQLKGGFVKNANSSPFDCWLSPHDGLVWRLTEGLRFWCVDLGWRTFLFFGGKGYVQGESGERLPHLIYWAL